MRILRLVDDGEFALELHPYITVVRDATAEQRTAIVAAFERAAVGRTSGVAGLMEVHGVVLDLDEASLGLLELGDGVIDVRVAPSDLPGSVTSGVGRRVEDATRRLESLEQPHRDRLLVLAEAEVRLEAAERAVAGTSDGDGGRAAAKRADLVARQRRLRDEQTRLVRRIGVLDAGDVDASLDPDVPLDPAAREDLLADLRAALALHELDDATAVRDALDEVRSAHSTGELVPSAEALGLADRIDALDREIGESDPGHGPPSSATLEEAADHVEQARLVLAELELQHEPDDSVTALEAVHAEVEAARDGLEGRFRRGRAQRRLDEALAREQLLLERLGLRSYTEYLTGGGATAPMPSVADDAVTAARRDVEQAEAAAVDLEAQVDAALAHAERVEERRRLRDEARALLGAPDLGDDVLTAALADLRVPPTGGGPIEDLADALDAVGLPVREIELSDHEIESMASDWLAERQHTEIRLRRRIEVLEAGATPTASTVPGSDGPVETPAVAARESLAADLAEVEASLAAVEAELVELDELDGGGEPPSVDAARAAVVEAAAAVDVGQADYAAAVEELAGLRQTATVLEQVAAPRVEEIEWYLLARLAGQRQQSFVGSLPLVIDGALDLVADDDGLTHLLDRLERMAGAVQIVHLTDDPRISDWAALLDPGRGAVVRPVVAREE